MFFLPLLSRVHSSVMFCSRFAIVEEEQMCAICDFPLLTRQFYVYPCNHEFHADCLINRVNIIFSTLITIFNGLIRLNRLDNQAFTHSPNKKTGRYSGTTFSRIQVVTNSTTAGR